MDRARLIEAIAVAQEVTGTPLMSDAAIEAMVRDLEVYPAGQVLAALKRCMREVKGRLTLADIIARIEDGRPGPEEAWSMVPKDEGSSVFWTTEMRDAFGVAYPLVKAGDNVQARMAFLERYRHIVQLARDARLPIEWEFSPGYDKDGRELVVLDAVQKGRLSVERAQVLLPHHREDVHLEARLLAAAGVPLALPEPPRARPAGLIKLGEAFSRVPDKSKAA